MNVRCRYWSKSAEYPDRGNCSLGVRELPDYNFCVGECRKYHEPNLPLAQRTVEKDQNKVDDFIAASAQLIKEGRVKEEVAQHRLTTCTGVTVEGQIVTQPCIHYTGTDKVRGDGKCKACGCKTWKISEMKLKVYYPIGCPVNRFSPMPGRRKMNVDNSSTRTQPEAKEEQGPGPIDPNSEGGWPSSQRI